MRCSQMKTAKKTCVLAALFLSVFVMSVQLSHSTAHEDWEELGLAESHTIQGRDVSIVVTNLDDVTKHGGAMCEFSGGKPEVQLIKVPASGSAETNCEIPLGAMLEHVHPVGF